MTTRVGFGKFLLGRARYRRPGVKLDHGGPPRPFLEKDRVKAIAIIDVPGTVIQAGPQVCGIKFDDGRHRFIPNDYLKHIK